MTNSELIHILRQYHRDSEVLICDESGLATPFMNISGSPERPESSILIWPKMGKYERDLEYSEE